MSQSLVINGKKYVPSGVVAAEVHYSSDYISKLAREERVLGTQIGRQWFIEPHSLKTYLEQIKIEKEISKEHLRRVRKLEHKTQEKKPDHVEKKKPLSIFDFAVLAQTFTVVACGVFLGSLVWLSEVEELSSTEIVIGVDELASYVALSVYPFNTSKFFLSDTRSFTAASAESSTFVSKDTNIDGDEVVVVYTQLPQFPPRGSIDNSFDPVPQMQDQFSDEVIVTDVSDGTMILKPVFKNRISNENFFIVTPVMQSQ